MMNGPPQEQVDLTPEQMMVNRLSARIAQMVVALEVADMRLEHAYTFIHQLGYDPTTGEPLVEPANEPSHNVQ